MMKQLLTRFRSLSRRRRRTVIAILLVAIALATVGIIWLLTPHRPAPVAAPISPAPSALEKGTPSYTTVIPKGRTIASLGGWTRVSPPDREPVYAYVDFVGKTRTIVSQQALPKTFLADPDGKTKELADAYNAKTVLTVGSTSVYTGVSTGGIESVIFRVKETLVLMKANTTINQTDLKEYINALI